MTAVKLLMIYANVKEKRIIAETVCLKLFNGKQSHLCGASSLFHITLLLKGFYFSFMDIWFHLTMVNQ